MGNAEHITTPLNQIHEQLFPVLERFGDPESESELGRLSELHRGAEVNVADSITSAMGTVACAAHTLAYLIEQDAAPSYVVAHASLIRQMLIGAYTVTYVLGPHDSASRDERARTLVAAEYASSRRAAAAASNFKSDEVATVRTGGEEWLDVVRKDRDDHQIAREAPDKTGAITVKGSQEFVELLVAVYRARDDNDEEMNARVMKNVPDTAEWAWQITSGMAHAYHWPHRLTGDDDIPLLLPQIIEAIRTAGYLCIAAASGTRSSFEEFQNELRGEPSPTSDA
ncbi:hypothetical protein [uncultured Brachybacterium sp.]|uniref:hypothetical protein n=1 Tax=uncultured Brachybacterium sp. TaxID=189680 RepID=UPI00261E2589|nr:hypothetical protein [uncultured Brachybacterium sp.]